MKKIITLFLVWGCLFSFSVKGANLYLIDNGNISGNNKVWGNPSITGFTNVYKVNLSTCNGGGSASLTQWLTDRNKTSAPSYTVTQIAGSAGNITFTTSDQVWIAAGTYNVSTAWTILSGSGAVVPGYLYGGFLGSESTVNDRISGANAWTFTNETYIHGTAAVNLFYAASDRTITFDGMTMDGFTNAIYQRGNMNVQNCKFTNNTNSAILFFNGTNNATVKDSYFYQNTVSGTNTNGAAISTSTTNATAIYTISGCVFESNSSTSTGNSSSASLRITAGTGGTYTCNINNCVFKNNKNTASSGTGRSSALTIYSNLLTVNMSNCLIYGDITNPGNIDAIYMVSGNITNCTLVNNYKGMYISASGTVKLKNVVLWGVEEGASTRLLSPAGIGTGGTQANITLDNCAYRTIGTVGTNNNPVALSLANTGATSSPNFTDPDNNLWSLAGGSSLLDTGTSTNAPTTDLNGLTRSGQGSNFDIGAYEAIQGNVNTTDITKLTPYSDISVLNGGLLTINSNEKINSLSVGIEGKATLSSGNTLESNNVNISASASGVGTIVDNGGTLTATTVKAQQQLTVARNWYMGSPVTGATGLPTVNAGSVLIYSYPENDAAQATGVDSYPAGGVWNTVSSGTFETGKGYIVKPSDANATVSFTGTSFNTGNITLNGLTYSAGNPKHGFNLIGNPYPSYINVLPSINANANLEPTVWYRTRDTNETPFYHFETVNATSGVGTNAAGTGRVTGYIPPMQGFWVRATANDQSVTLNNSDRSHATTVSMTDIGEVPTTVLKAPAATKSEYSLLGLYVSNGSTGDEAILMFAPEASNDLDAYDSQKISNYNSSIPEIYTTSGSVQLAINGMENFPETEVPLGFTTGTAGNFTFRVSEHKNFDGKAKVYLLDKQENKQTELTPESEYTFSSTTTTANESRFSLLFKAPGTTTANVNTESDGISVFVNTQNEIVINAVAGSRYAIYNTAGQQIATGKTGSDFETVNHRLSNGVYVVKVGSVSKRVVLK